MTEARWLSRFTDASRQAERYRAGRILLAGDARMFIFPAGGPGLSTGLGRCREPGLEVGRGDPGLGSASLLDSYHAERPRPARGAVHTRLKAR